MKILFVLDKRVDAGSIHAVANYVQAADEAGHVVALYGHPDPRYPAIHFSTDPAAFDHVIFIAETGLQLSSLQLGRILAVVPRSRRAVVDTDGMYNPLTILDGYDRNHASDRERDAWVARHGSVASIVLQPTLEPAQSGTLAVPFFGYSPALRADARDVQKTCDVVCVGHNWWRWREVSTFVLPAIQEVRDQLGKICFVGSWWDAPPPWAEYLALGPAFQVDAARFLQLRIDTRPAVPYSQVVRTMSEGRINIMLQRPLLRHLRLLTAKYFELFCADTIPLVAIDPDHAQSIYGTAGRELALYPDVAQKIADAASNEKRYIEIVEAVRCHLEVHHSYRRRLQELVSVLRITQDESQRQALISTAAVSAGDRGLVCD